MSKKILALLLSACIFMTGCGSDVTFTKRKNPTEIELSWWGNDARTEYTIEGARKFEELHPDIEVKVSYSEWSGYEARNRIRMVSGTEADVMQVNYSWLKEYSPDGKGFYNILDQKRQVNLSNFSQPMLEYGIINGSLNAVPIAMNAETIYINKTIFDKYNLDIPETWDDYKNAAKVMSKDGIYPIAGVGKSVWLFAIAYAEQKTGKQILNDDGTLNFTEDDLKIMLNFYSEMVECKVFPAIEYFDKLNVENGTYAGAIAWVSDAINYFGSLIEKGEEIVAAPYPHDDSHKSGDGWYAKPASLYAMSKDTDHPEEAAMLLDFLVNSEEMALLQGVEKGVPLSTKARDTLDKNDMLKGLQYDASLVMENNENLSKMNAYIEDSGMIDIFVAECDNVIFKKLTAEEAAKELYAELTAE